MGYMAGEGRGQVRIGATSKKGITENPCHRYASLLMQEAADELASA